MNHHIYYSIIKIIRDGSLIHTRKVEPTEIIFVIIFLTVKYEVIINDKETIRKNVIDFPFMKMRSILVRKKKIKLYEAYKKFKSKTLELQTILNIKRNQKLWH